MKIAFCFSGQPRDVRNTIEKIKESWSKNHEVDFFYHSWWGNNNTPFRNDAPSDTYSESIFEYIDRVLNPVNSLIESPIFFEKRYNDSVHWPCYHPVFNLNPDQNIQSMFYSMKQCNELKKNYEQQNNFLYDAVVKCRFDYIFSKEYNLRDFDLNCLHTKNDCMHTYYAINDHIALSNSKNMDIYCSLFDSLEEHYNNGVEFNPEVILGYHIAVNGLQVNKTLGDGTESYVSTQKERAKSYS
jgi:hypothetical protein